MSKNEEEGLTNEESQNGHVQFYLLMITLSLIVAGAISSLDAIEIIELDGDPYWVYIDKSKRPAHDSYLTNYPHNKP